MTLTFDLSTLKLFQQRPLLLAALTYSAMHEQRECTIQLFAAAKCPKMDILLQQIAESYILADASLSNLTRP